MNNESNPIATEEVKAPEVNLFPASRVIPATCDLPDYSATGQYRYDMRIDNFRLIDPNDLTIAVKNPREAKDLEPNSPNVKGLLQLIKVKWNPDSILTVHQNSQELNGNTNLEILCGNTRKVVAKILRLPFVPCKVLEGLTELEKDIIRVNPPENPRGLAGDWKAVWLLTMAGAGRLQIQLQTGVKEGKVQEWQAAFTFPETVEQEYKGEQIYKKEDPKRQSRFKFSRTNTLDLGAAVRRDREGVRLRDLADKKSEESNGVGPINDVKGGPEFWRLFEYLNEKGIVEKPKIDETLQTLSQGIKDCEPLRSLIYACADKAGGDRQTRVDAVKDDINLSVLNRQVEGSDPDLNYLMTVNPSPDKKVAVARKQEVYNWIAAILKKDRELHPANVSPRVTFDDDFGLVKVTVPYEPTAIVPAAVPAAPVVPSVNVTVPESKGKRSK